MPLERRRGDQSCASRSRRLQGLQERDGARRTSPRRLAPGCREAPPPRTAKSFRGGFTDRIQLRGHFCPRTSSDLFAGIAVKLLSNTCPGLVELRRCSLLPPLTRARSISMCISIYVYQPRPSGNSRLQPHSEWRFRMHRLLLSAVRVHLGGVWIRAEQRLLRGDEHELAYAALRRPRGQRPSQGCGCSAPRSRLRCRTSLQAIVRRPA